MDNLLQQALECPRLSVVAPDLWVFLTAPALGASCPNSLQAQSSSFWWAPPPGSASPPSSPLEPAHCLCLSSNTSSSPWKRGIPSLLPYGKLCWEHHSSLGASVRASSCWSLWVSGSRLCQVTLSTAPAFWDAFPVQRPELISLSTLL